MSNITYFPLMILILFLLINNIFSSTPCSDYSNPSYGFINVDNDLIILNSVKDKKELRIYKKDTNLNNYQLNTTLNLIQFPVNESIYIDINNLYHVYDKSNGEVIFFNDEYYSIYNYSYPSYNYFYDFYFSCIENNKFIIPNFFIEKKIEIFQFNYDNETKFSLLSNIPIKTSSSDTYPIKYLKCISTNNHNICGYILSTSLTANYESLILFFIDSNYNKTEDIKIYEYKLSTLSILNKRWLELIPIGSEKLLYCVLNDNNEILCGLGKIEKNFNITVLKAPEIIFDSLSKDNDKPVFHNIILNNNEVVLGCRTNKKNLKIKKITINNNVITKNEIAAYTLNVNIINHFQMLEDNNNNLMLLVNYNTTSNKIVNVFYYLGYSTCQNITQTIYNGEKTKLNFDVMLPIVNLNQINHDIVFMFDNKELVSLITTNGSGIVTNQTYKKTEIYFKLNSTNFDYIKNKGVYSVIYSNNINENLAQKCSLNLKFYICSSSCDLCTSDGKCYDKYWNRIYHDIPDSSDKENEAQNSNSSYAVIVIFVIIFIIMLIACIFFCRKKNNNIDYAKNNDFIQPQNPLINDYNNYNYNNNQNYNNNNQNYNNNSAKRYDNYPYPRSDQDLNAPNPYYSS